MSNWTGAQKRIYILAILLFIAILAYLSSVRGKKIELIESSTKNDSIQISISIPKFNYLNDSKFQEELNNSIENKVKNFVEEIRKIAQQDREEGVQRVPYEANVKTEIYYQDKDLVSMIIYYYQFTGGAHGTTTFETYNIDIKNSKLLNLSDILDKNAEDMIKKEIIKQIKSQSEYFFPESVNYISKDNIFARNFLIEATAITFIYPHYEIAPYATGMPMFSIEWQRLKQYIVYEPIKKFVK